MLKSTALAFVFAATLFAQQPCENLIETRAAAHLRHVRRHGSRHR